MSVGLVHWPFINGPDMESRMRENRRKQFWVSNLLKQKVTKTKISMIFLFLQFGCIHFIGYNSVVTPRVLESLDKAVKHFGLTLFQPISLATIEMIN